MSLEPSFVTGPGKVSAYIQGLATGEAKRSVGHNPAGAAMTIALLLALAGTTGTGMALLAVEEGQGPLSPFIVQEGGEAGTAPAARVARSEYREAEEDEDEEGHESSEADGEGAEREGHGEGGGEELLETLHSTFVYLTLALAAVHVLGVLASSIAHGENLPKAMVTGRKRL